MYPYTIEICLKEQNMAKCVHCGADATYLVENPGTNAQTFCDAHLPGFLKNKNYGFVKELQPVVEYVMEPEVVEEEAKPVKKKRKRAAAVVEETQPE